jgi:hypothetical protein
MARALCLVVLVAVGAIAGATASSAAPYDELSVQCRPGPSCLGWYREPVTVRWTISGADGALPSCLPQTYGADTPSLRLVCTAWTGMRDTGETTMSTVIRIDATPPAVVATPARPPDRGGWFNHPVGVGFHGEDATSGVASCEAGSYGGPDGAGVTVAGTCRDVAGNVGAGSLTLNYDSTPPPAPRAAARPGNGTIDLGWTAPEADVVQVTRATQAAAPTLVFDGRGDGFTDQRLRNEARYRYVVTAIDRAGNRAQTLVSAVPTASPLLSPARGSRLEGPPLLLWKPVKRAAYYNVQLFRNGRKLLSRWPASTRLRLGERWRFDGGWRQLGPGRYRWHVWPGYGKRAERRYGKRLGTSTFTVVR